METPLIEIEKLKRGYTKTHNFIFDNFDFKLFEKEFIVLLGRSGSGKTTLVKFLIRQLKPPRKTIFHKKEDISRFSNSEVQKYRRDIGVIFQDFKLIEWKSVYENISYNLEMRLENSKKQEKRVNEVLYKVGLFDKKYSKIPYLSGGEKQRVAIARALISNPKFIIADEPTGNLDNKTSQQIVDLLINLNKTGNTVLFITHDTNLVQYLKTKKQKIKEIDLD